LSTPNFNGKPSGKPELKKISESNALSDGEKSPVRSDMSIDTVDREFVENVSWDTNSQEFLLESNGSLEDLGEDLYSH